MDKSIKKTIAREGLILLGIVIIGVMLTWVNDEVDYTHIISTWKGKIYLIPERYIFSIRLFEIGDIYFIKYGIGTFLLFLVYPIYLLIRFIIWAIKTLREK